MRSNVLRNNIIGSIAIKGGALCVTLASTPAYIRYFENDSVLGVWFVIVSILNWILTFDLGIGNGLRNQLAYASSGSDETEMKKVVSSGYVSLGVVCAVLALAGVFAIPAFDWNALLNISEDIISSSVLKSCIFIVYFGMVAQFWLKLITSVLYSLQKTAVANSVSLVSSILLLIFLLVHKGGDQESRLMALSIAQVLCINLPLIVATVCVFMTTLKHASPSPSFVSLSHSKGIVALGGAFFAIQIFLLIANSTNEFVIGFLYSSADVVGYQVYYRIFSLVIVGFSLVVQPMWSAMASAYAEKNFSWLAKAYHRFSYVSAGGILFALALVFAAPVIIPLWVGPDVVTVDVRTSLIFMFYASITLLVNSSTSVANATSRLKTQLVFSAIAAAAKVPLCCAFAHFGLGWDSVVFANCVALLPLLVAQTISTRKYLAKR
ncbi:MATE family efflux transporter [Parvibacter caecicola]|nr:MATE family efflux transporter [Parvibacter caecicola]